MVAVARAADGDGDGDGDGGASSSRKVGRGASAGAGATFGVATRTTASTGVLVRNNTAHETIANNEALMSKKRNASRFARDRRCERAPRSLVATSYRGATGRGVSNGRGATTGDNGVIGSAARASSHGTGAAGATGAIGVIGGAACTKGSTGPTAGAVGGIEGGASSRSSSANVVETAANATSGVEMSSARTTRRMPDPCTELSFDTVGMGVVTAPATANPPGGVFRDGTGATGLALAFAFALACTLVPARAFLRRNSRSSASDSTARPTRVGAARRACATILMAIATSFTAA